MIDKIDEALEVLESIENPDHFIRLAIKDLKSQKQFERQKEFGNRVRTVRDIINNNECADEDLTTLDVDIYYKLEKYFKGVDKAQTEPTMLGPQQARETPPARSTRWKDAHGDIWYWEDAKDSPTATQGWTTAHLRTGGHWENLGWINGSCFPLTLVE